MIPSYCILHDTRTMRPIRDFQTLQEAAEWLNIRLIMYGPQKFQEYFLARYDDGDPRGALGGQELLTWLTYGGKE